MTDLELLSAIRTEFQKLAFIHKDILTIDEAAAFTGLETGTLKNYVYRKILGAYKPGKGHSAKLYFLKADLESYMMQNRIKSDLEISAEAATFTKKRKTA